MTSPPSATTPENGPENGPETGRESGDPAARFDAWVVAHHAAVYRSAWRITRNGADAEDVAQQVFLHVFQKLASRQLDRPEWTTLADAGDRLRWLAVKTALTFRRGEANRRRREEARAMETSELSNAGRGPDPARAELLQELRIRVAHLPDELRVATVLRFQEGLAFAAMAELAGVSEPTMFERVKRALEKLRVGLAQAGHAGALVELEVLLAVEESVAVPAKLCSTLLALPSASVAAAAVTTTATASASGGWFAAAAAVVVLAGGVAVVRGVRSSPTSPSGSGSAEPPRSSGDEAAAARLAVPAAPAPEPLRTADLPTKRDATLATNVGGGERMRASELLWCDMQIPAADEESARLVDVAHVYGFVHDDDGRSLPGVKIVATSSEDAPKAFAWRSTAESRADGAFDLRVATVVAEGQHYRLTFDHPDMLRRERDAVVAPGSGCDLAGVELQRNVKDRAGDFELALTLVGPDGEPVRDAIVRMYRKFAARPKGEPVEMVSVRCEWQAGGVTDEHGTIRLAGSRVGEKRFEILAHRAGYRDQIVALRIESTGASEQSVTLQPGLAISGRLVVPENADASAFLRGAQLDAVPLVKRGFFDEDPFVGDVDPDGRFRLRGLDPGGYRLRVRGGFSAFVVEDVAAGRDDLALPLKRADDPTDVGLHRAEIHGRVVDAEHGEPLAVPPDALELHALPASLGPDDPRVADEWLPKLLGPQQEQTAQVLIDGSRPPPAPASSFHFDDLDAGNYVVVIRADGRKPAVSRVVTVAENQIARDVVIALEQ